MPEILATDVEEVEAIGPRVISFEIAKGREGEIRQAVARLAKRAARHGLPGLGLFCDPDQAEWRDLRSTLVVKDEDGARESSLPSRRVEVMPAFLAIPPAGWEPSAKWKVSAVLLATDTDELEVFGRDQARADVARWSRLSLCCQHCERRVQRVRTLLLTNKEDGREIQVGVECAQGYVGDQYAKLVVDQQFYSEVFQFVQDTLLNESAFAGWALTTYPPEEVVAHAVASIRTHGWLSSKNDYGEPNVGSTADRVEEGLRSPDERTYEVTEADREEARSIVDWLSNISEEEASKGGSYMAAMAAAFSKDWISEKRVRFVASAPRAYKRRAEQKKYEERKAHSAHQGVLGQKLEIVATLERYNSYDSEWGTTHIYSFRDTNGNAFVWKTGTYPIHEDDVNGMFVLKGTVKGHSEFREEKQTELTRVKAQPYVVNDAEAGHDGGRKESRGR